MMAATRLLASAWHRHVLWTVDSPVLYHAATLGPNYVDAGFVRRGLGGAIVRVLHRDLLHGTVIFHVLSAAALIAAAGWLFTRIRAPVARRLAFAALLVALTLRWGEDAGRTDVVVAALLALATISWIRGWRVGAVACIASGLFIHETSFVFGLPLLLALHLERRRMGTLGGRQSLAIASLLAASLILYLAFDQLPRASIPAIVANVRGRLPAHEFVDWALYFAVSGGRGVRTSLCQNAGDPTYGMHLLAGIAVLAIFMFVLRRSGRPSWPALLIGSLPPFLFLGIVANDLARWTVLAAFNIWLLCAAAGAATSTSTSTSAEGAGGRRRGDALGLVVAMLLIPLLHPKLWRIDDPIFAPVPVLDRIVQELGGPKTTHFADALARCDPGWRDALAGPPAR